jgi:hypothetical protein
MLDVINEKLKLVKLKNHFASIRSIVHESKLACETSMKENILLMVSN